MSGKAHRMKKLLPSECKRGMVLKILETGTASKPTVVIVRVSEEPTEDRNGDSIILHCLKEGSAQCAEGNVFYIYAYRPERQTIHLLTVREQLKLRLSGVDIHRKGGESE